MSISTIMNSINQLSKEIFSLEKAFADEIKKEADKNKRINDINKSITKNTSASMLQSKSRQIQLLNNDLSKIYSKKADINKKLVDKKSKLNDLNVKLQKEQQIEEGKRQTSQDRARKSYEDKISKLTTQLENSIAIKHIAPIENYAPIDKAEPQFDVFISHASEDKEGFVRDLATTLINEYGFKVWYDEFSIKWGDSLRTAIDKGLTNSKFGIVVISRSFIKKGWTNYELDGLFQKEMTLGKTILPIWHDITKDEVQAFSASLSGRKALNTAMFTIQEIAEELKNILELEE
ncbi:MULTISPECIES: TIR domain-containing protein [Bacteria]|uniref:Toll/interleukin-1 receptor domain-containing protein n=1 Tax=Clostridium beijerinckii TaxID=1520 RepID=A0AAW3W8W2_CLOBE|nr:MULTISPECIES: toll/interleukin-1 receptor domain-containing protein [Bacteria]MBC2457787.1 toll/interleukin-1 receptor domain-containing protein [Clostridium beijerinckii]MBC2475022.1 toll/interleukin-1 receptor domain-containing protein [Clostridium beijerinckii]MRY42785.1 TIR domain-containing protein [Parabacteroides distasonis]MZK52009.1 TIR domain-containing protein [Clostridium beijerinckii]MZK60150.1 TIR domain-containing protein [Clostridium beijerinckii]